jgi:DNA transformation protein
MTRQNEFLNYLLELVRPIGLVTSRAMFGSHGTCMDGIIFGPVIDGAFYPKEDDVNHGEFDEGACGHLSKARKTGGGHFAQMLPMP